MYILWITSRVKSLFISAVFTPSLNILPQNHEKVNESITPLEFLISDILSLKHLSRSTIN